MSIDLFTSILLILVIVLIAYIAYMKGQKSRSNQSNSNLKPGVTSQSSSNKEKYTTINVNDIQPIKKQPVKRDPENTKHLQRVKKELEKSCQKIADNITYKVFEPFLESYDSLSMYYSSLSEQQNTPINGIEKMVNWGPIGQIRTIVETNIIDSTQFAVTFCYGSIQYLSDSYPNAHLNRLVKSNAQIEVGTQRLQSSIRKNLPAFYSELSELGSHQTRCLSLWRGAKAILNESDVDIPSLAKNFGAGVLIAFNPLIGIPALVASIVGDNEKAKRKQETIDEFFDAFSKYLNKWDEVRNIVVQTIAPFVVRDTKTFIVSEGQDIILKCFEAADTVGYSIKEKSDELITYLTE